MRSGASAFLIAVLAFSLIRSSEAAASKVLYLGDSMSMGAFGKTLDEKMRSEELEVHTYVAGGASPYYWLSRYDPISCSIGYWEKTPAMEKRVGYIRAVPKVEELVEKCKPDVVVVQTGVNLYASLRSKRRTKEENVKLVESLIIDMCRAVHSTGAFSYWITPPASHPKRFPSDLQEELTSIMKRVVGGMGGRVFESAEVTNWTASYPSHSDGVHYGPDESTDWAAKVADDFTGFVSHLDSYPKPSVVVSVSLPTDVTEAEQPRPVVAAKIIGMPDPAPEPKETVGMAEPEVTVGSTSKVPASSETASTQVGAPRTTEESKVAAPGNLDLAETKASDEVQVKLKLLKKSQINHLNEVIYSSAFGLFEYEVEEVLAGTYPHKTLRIAHMIVLNKEFTGPNRFTPGKSYHLTLVKMDKYPSLQRIQMVDQLELDLDLPIYVCKF